MFRIFPFNDVKDKLFIALISEPMFLRSLRVVMFRLLLELMVENLLVRLAALI